MEKYGPDIYDLLNMFWSACAKNMIRDELSEQEKDESEIYGLEHMFLKNMSKKRWPGKICSCKTFY